jgi:2-polyprenyl-6-methoxyphenol hydroxylase-like FAD-dependent oxidoreductase
MLRKWPATDAHRRGHVLLAGDAVHIHSPAGART